MSGGRGDGHFDPANNDGLGRPEDMMGGVERVSGRFHRAVEIAKRWMLFPNPGALVLPWLASQFGDWALPGWWVLSTVVIWVYIASVERGQELGLIRSHIVDRLKSWFGPQRLDDGTMAPSNALKQIAVLLIGAAGFFFVYRLGLVWTSLYGMGGLVSFVLLCRIEGPWLKWWSGKFSEWRRDLRHFGLWWKLANDPHADAQAHAAMAHQQQFLQGRALNPVSVLKWVPAALALSGLIFGLWHWRGAEKARAQRDRACTTFELSGQTTRQACADLTEERRKADGWMEAAVAERDARNAVEDRWREDVEAARVEAQRSADLRITEQRRRIALEVRQRRRENEAIEAALGGPPPDWDAGLREFASDRSFVDPGAPDDSAIGGPEPAPDSPSGVSGDAPTPAPL